MNKDELYADTDIIATWVGSDGTKYGTRDADMVRRRIAFGHTNFEYLAEEYKPLLTAS